GPAAGAGLLRPRQPDAARDPRPRRVRGQRARRAAAAAVRELRAPRPGGSPRLEDVLAVLECTVEHMLPGGDHEIVVGRVRHAETGVAALPPLLYYRGAYVELASLGALVRSLAPARPVMPAYIW